LVLDEPKENDEKLDLEGVSFVVEKELLSQSGGISIDVVKGYFGEELKVTAKKPTWQSDSDCGSCCR